MLDNTIVITYANTSLHIEYQKEFYKLYSDKFLNIINYTDDDIKSTDFWNNNMQMFQYKKYGGYFLWKPYIIIKTLKENPGRDILYCDSNLRFTNFSEFERLYNYSIKTNGIFLVKCVNFINKEWTKRDAFILMNADNERYYNAHQLWTSLMGFSNTQYFDELLNDYLLYCKNPSISTEEPNVLGENLPEFKEHRWEQSVLSILTEKYSCPTVNDDTVMKYVTKHYSPELMKMKEKINENPLAKSI